MSFKYSYRCFGFTVGSDLKVPLLKETEPIAVPDLTIRRDDLSERSGCGFYYTRDTYFSPGDDFSCLIENGSSITVDCEELPQNYLCPLHIDVIARHRKLFILHGVAVCDGNRAVLITGGHGAGKSTLAHEMLRRGWKFMTDDVAVIEEQDGVFYIRSGYPVQKLRRDTLERYDCSDSSPFPVISKTAADKYYVDVSSCYYDGRLPLELIVFPEPSEESFSVSELKGVRKFEALRPNILNFNGIPSEERNNLVDFALRLSSRVSMLRMVRTDIADEYNAVMSFLNRFNIKLGGKAIQLLPYSETLRRVFRDYLSDEQADFSVLLTSKLVDEEAEIRKDYARTRESRFVLSDALSEESAACRAVSERLPEYGSFLLHGSAIAYKGEGMVFVASSGTGKSTFSRSWINTFHGDVTYINDDKPYVRIENGSAFLFGSPWNGKHHLGSNTSCPLKAICLLERSETNNARKVSAAEVLPELLSHLYIPEAPSGRSALFSLIQQLSRCVSFYRVGCNTDPDAAAACREVLFK